ncbi:MAG TPA: ABC transporter permease [Candidatus Dormibacteraeota bacterium]|nr:ABC transporter permease [Candidatus Dormibacteraeota bacterium]
MISRFARHRMAMAGAVLLVLVCLAVILAPLLARQGADAVNLFAQNQRPGAGHLLGTDSEGRDIFARTLYGGRVSLIVGVAAVLISLGIGILLGGIAGYFRGGWDWVIMRITDVAMTFPPVVIILTVAAIIGPGLWNTVLIIGLLNWPIPGRLVRARILSVREYEYIDACRATGASSWRILFRHALPNAVDVIVVTGTLGVANAILLEAGMSFLGLGVQPPTPSWGNLLSAANQLNVLVSYPWQWVPAGVAVVITVLSINLIGDGLRDVLDPRAGR